MDRRHGVVARFDVKFDDCHNGVYHVEAFSEYLPLDFAKQALYAHRTSVNLYKARGDNPECNHCKADHVTNAPQFVKIWTGIRHYIEYNDGNNAKNNENHSFKCLSGINVGLDPCICKDVGGR